MSNWIEWTRNTGMVFLLLVVFLLTGNSCGSNGKAEHNEDMEGVESSEEVTDTATDDETSHEGEDENSVPGVPVEVTRAIKGEISSYLLLSSTIETESNVDIFSRATGLVDEIHVEEGDVVRKGAILARLEDEEYALDAAKAEVGFHKLENDFKRIEQMYQDELISVEGFENAQFELRQAELEWQKADLLLRHTRIEAPISGVISKRLVNVGDRVTNNTQVYSIVNLESMITVVHVPEREIDRVATHQHVKIDSDYMRGEDLEGWVKRISPVVDPNSGTFKVTIGIRDAGNQLKPGMFVNVHIVTGTHDDAVLVPRDAIVYDGGKEFLFLASEDSTAERVELDKGFSNNRIVEVLSGIEMDDLVIVVGQSGIKDGAKIKVLEERTVGEEEAAS